MKRAYAGLLLPLFFAVGCTSQPKNEPELPLDMKTVAEYNSKISSGNTVPPSQRNKEQKQPDYPLNASDSRERRALSGYGSRPIAVVPSIGIGYGYYHHSGRHWHHW